MTFLKSQNKYKYVQISLKLHTSFTIKAIPPPKPQSVIPLLKAGISGLKTVFNLTISVGTILKVHSKHSHVSTKLSGNCPFKPSLANKRHAAYILTSQKAKTTVDCPNCLKILPKNLV